MAAKPDCALCGQPYHRHNIGSITTCPIVATYRPLSPTPDAGEVQAVSGRGEVRELEAPREALGKAIYNALYANQGGLWECVETREVWYRKADRIIAEHQLPFFPNAEDGSERGVGK